MPCILKIQSWLFICAFQKQIDLPDLFESTNMLWFHRHIAAKGLKIHCYELLIIVEPKKVSVQCNKNDMVDTCRHVVDIFSSCHRTLQWWNFCLFWVHSKIRNSLRANFKNSAKCNFIKFMSDVFFSKNHVCHSIFSSFNLAARHQWFGRSQSSQSEHIHRLVHENPYWASLAILHSLPPTNLEIPPTNSSCSRLSDPGRRSSESHWMFSSFNTIRGFNDEKKHVKRQTWKYFHWLHVFSFTFYSLFILYNRKTQALHALHITA